MNLTLVQLILLFTPTIIFAGDIGFYLTNYRSDNQLYDPNNPGPWKANFDSSCTTVFLVNGWLNPPCVPPFQDTAAAYKQLPSCDGCYNVVRVYWADAYTINYCSAAAAILNVGVAIKQFIEGLYACGAITGRVDCTGHNLGAHVCGVAGRGLRADNYPPFTVITGLDPANDCVSFYSLLCSPLQPLLLPTDATIVSTLKTNGGVFGTNLALGTVNFQANDGSCQPGCLLGNPWCSSLRSIDLYTEAVTFCWFVGVSNVGTTATFGRCMPLNVNTGYFYFSTRASPLYGAS